MSKVKCIYHRCTSRGGAGAKIQSHILQICHFYCKYVMEQWARRQVFKKIYGEAVIDENDLFVESNYAFKNISLNHKSSKLSSVDLLCT